MVIQLLGCLGLGAKDYYVAPTGNDDSNTGTEGSPFASIQKAAYVMVEGDRCIIHAGTYRESITPSSSKVEFIAAEGEEVIVSGYDPVSDWSVNEGQIYVTQLDWDLGDENQVFYEDQMMVLARWPNKTNFNPFDPEAVWGNGNFNSVTQFQIPDQNWGNGGVIWFLGRSRWTSWRRPITGSNEGSVTFETLPTDWHYGGTHSPSEGGEVVLMNTLEALDNGGEWYIDRNDRKLYFRTPGGESPMEGNVQVRRRTVAFDLSDKTGVVLDGLIIRGGNIDLSNAKACVIRNCRILYGNHTISSDRSFQVPEASILLNDNSEFNFIIRNEIQWGAGNGVIIKGVGNRLDNNYIGNFNYLGSYACPVELRGGNDVTRNEIFNGGRDLIRGGGFASNVGYNDLHHSNLLNDDCGAIYTCCDTDYGFTRIHHNWIHDISSRNEHYPSYKGTGIYLDNSSREVIVDHNVVWNMEWSCVQINWAGEHLRFYNNTFWSNDGPNSVSMARWVNGYEIDDIPVYNSLVNNDQLVYTEVSNNTVLGLTDDPFEDFANRNFFPKAGSQAIDAGREVEDITNGIFGSAPDTGAYERNGTYWIPGPDWKLGERPNNQTYLPNMQLKHSPSRELALDCQPLNPFSEYIVEYSADLDAWEEHSHFTAPFSGIHTVPLEETEVPQFYRLTELFEVYIPPITGNVMTFSQYEGQPHNTHVTIGTELTEGLPDGVTVTIRGQSDGFGVNANSINPLPVSTPSLFVWGDGPGSSFLFSKPVIISSFWTVAPGHALANDPNGEQKITGKLNGEEVWTFTNSETRTNYFEVNEGAEQTIDELVVYPKWIGIDNIQVEN